MNQPRTPQHRRQPWSTLLVLLASPFASLADDTPPLAAQVAHARAEYEAQQERASKAANEAKSEAEGIKQFRVLDPSPLDYCRKMMDLATPNPKDPGARDALLWILDQPGMGPSDQYAEFYNPASILLLQHHAQDLEVAREAMTQAQCSFTLPREAFLMGIYVSAQDREAKGLARLALAHYLQRLAAIPIPPMFTGQNPRAQLAPENRAQHEAPEFKLPLDHAVSQVHRGLLDPTAVRAGSERLYTEVIDNYADIPLLTTRMKKLAARLKAKPLEAITDPEERTEYLAIERHLAKRQTLGQFAEEALDEMHALAPGQPAPEVDGKDLEGRTLHLSELRGKVVLLVFWGTWCGPCMAAIPEERKLAERFQGKPFALLGINCDEDIEAARKAARDEPIPWRNWADGAPGEGPIQKRYHIRAYPTQVLIDARGMLHARGHLPDPAREIEELLKAAEGPKGE